MTMVVRRGLAPARLKMKREEMAESFAKVLVEAVIEDDVDQVGNHVHVLDEIREKVAEAEVGAAGERDELVSTKEVGKYGTHELRQPAEEIYHENRDEHRVHFVLC